MGEPEAKASAFNSAVMALRGMTPVDAFDRMVATLPSETQQLVRHPPLPLEWIAVRHFRALTTAALEQLFAGDEKRRGEGPAAEGGADHSLLCEPSQRGWPFVALQPQNQTVPDFSALYSSGFMPTGRCEPSQKGCVALRPIPHVESAACEVKRLYVRPRHRGRHIAGALMDALEAYARAARYRAIYLDSRSDFDAAIRLYERRGYARVPPFNDNPEATVFMRLAL